LNSLIDPHKLVAWDIEIHKEIPWILKFPDGTESEPYYDHDAALAAAVKAGPEARLVIDDFDKHRPLGITCAAVYGPDVAEVFSAVPGQPMSKLQAGALIVRLRHLASQGYTLVTWNGLGFDFKTLAEEADAWRTCAKLALGHWDIMFQFFCLYGYAIGQDATARGMGLPGKPEAMDGAIAPIAWKDGRHQEVLDYVMEDAHQLFEIANRVSQAGEIKWIARSGKLARRDLAPPLLCRGAMALPLPDTSWMDSPWPRSQFHGWTEPHLS
jgi:hypothetical protein